MSRRRPCSSSRAASRRRSAACRTDAGARHLFRFLDDLRRVQQRLRRNAADVETDAAELRPALDQRDFHAEIGRAERSGVAAGTGAEHDDIEVVGCSERMTVGVRTRSGFGVAAGFGALGGCWASSELAAGLRLRAVASAVRCRATAARPLRARAITLPLETRSPFFTATAFTTPAADDGTSIVAFSVSSVISGVSSCDLIARLHEHVDDFDVLEIAEIGNVTLTWLGLALHGETGSADASSLSSRHRLQRAVIGSSRGTS